MVAGSDQNLPRVLIPAPERVPRVVPDLSACPEGGLCLFVCPWGQGPVVGLSCVCLSVCVHGGVQSCLGVGVAVGGNRHRPASKY